MRIGHSTDGGPFAPPAPLARTADIGHLTDARRTDAAHPGRQHTRRTTMACHQRTIVAILALTVGPLAACTDHSTEQTDAAPTATVPTATATTTPAPLTTA